MLFNSVPFVFFLPVTLVIFYLAPKQFRALILLIASYIFYASWDPRFLSLIVASTLTDFFADRMIHRTEADTSRRAWLLLSIGVNLGILGFFKYWGFFVDSVAVALSDLGLEPTSPN
jgi:D-alanyl-lipoteichoic acid acyltransferase DltB (MBOAT superfamily)